MSSKLFKLSAGLIVVLLLVGGALASKPLWIQFLSDFPSRSSTTTDNNDDSLVKVVDPEEISPAAFTQTRRELQRAEQLAKSGAYAEAAAAFEEIASGAYEGELTADQLAQARQSTLFRYRVTGDPKDSLAAVEDLKANILDPRVSAERKANSINTLATGYCWFARDEAVLEAIFAEEPFSRYWKGDPNESAREMLLWSLEVDQTPKAAATLAYWYADQVLKNDFIEKTLTEQQRREYIDETRKYVEMADRIAAEDLAQDPYYKDTQRYIGYLYRRAVGVGLLAVVGEVGPESYRNAYDIFFKEITRQNNHNGSGYIGFAYMWRAKFEQLLGAEQATIVPLLKAVIEYVENDPVQQANEIVDFIADKAGDADGRFSWHAIQTLRTVSPEWDAFVREIELANID